MAPHCVESLRSGEDGLHQPSDVSSWCAPASGMPNSKAANGSPPAVGPRGCASSPGGRQAGAGASTPAVTRPADWLVTAARVPASARSLASLPAPQYTDLARKWRRYLALATPDAYGGHPLVQQEWLGQHVWSHVRTRTASTVREPPCGHVRLPPWRGGTDMAVVLVRPSSGRTTGRWRAWRGC